MNVNDKIFLTQKANNINLFIYTNVTQQSQIDVQVNNVEVNSFALFGFNKNNQFVSDSNINISLRFQVITGALLCTICNIEAQRCHFVFIASGKQISGMIIEPKYSFTVQQCSIQYRLNSINSSGLTNVVKQNIILIIDQSQLSGSNLLYSSNNGYIASTIFVLIQLNISDLQICVDNTSRLGQESVQIVFVGNEFASCDLCEQNMLVVYGLCSETLNYSEAVNGIYQCVYPFEYVDTKCICAYGFMLNNTLCINIVESINNINNVFSSYNNDYILLLEQKIENQLIINQMILNNIKELENIIQYDNSQFDHNLMMNTSILDNRIYYNVSTLQNDLQMLQITADTNLLTNSTVLDQRIFNNATALNNNIQNLTLHQNDIDDSMLKFKQIIEQQQNTINNLIQQINCTSNYGYSMIDGSCVQVSCPIQGQQNINGICQCTNINSIVVDGQCVCPINSNVIGSACVCSISGQTIQNGQCVCFTEGAFVDNNVCTCGVNSINISNTCACPSNSQIVNNECVCNIISGQTMKNGLCSCLTAGAFVNDGVCTCGQNALNITNMCICPINSSLVNNICTCDKIQGQQAINGMCLCPSGQSVVNNSCQQTNYVINISNFECSQIYFIQQFDIESITKHVSTSQNFDAGYVFSASTKIENAFVDVSDNIYTALYPLFQFQINFMNIKIRFGTQTLTSGSFILSSTSSVFVNQMNIISKIDSQLTVNSQLNILTSTSMNASVTNLLVNLSFAPSTGNITLINNINGVFNISGYQVLGSFVSTKTVAMIGINVNAEIIYANLVSFQPSAFKVGNGSSYLFGSSVSTKSSIFINNFAVVLGNSVNFLLLDSIQTTNSENYYYYFGGIIAHINSNSIVNVINIILDSYQKLSTSYVCYSGFLVGFVQSSTSEIYIKNLCLQQSITSTTQFFYYLGLIGWNSGCTTIQNVSVVFSIQTTAQIYCFGIIGIQLQSSLYTEVLNVISTVSFSSNSGNFVGSVIGAEEAIKCSINNTNIVGGSINSGSNYVGGFSGYQLNNTITINNSSIFKTNISGSTQIGGFVGLQTQTSSLYLINSNIQVVCLYGSNYVGIVVGNNNGVNFISGSSSTQNYINSVMQNNCAVLQNTISIVGC
ncbi:Conserved_hypothetical protein [Hexamita inflata]|uniref:Uncharacterized protein n=1 Tax=Hexamita inflata TaxID=28002 RepID=A0AA86NBB6_9EUKA|nr:Conserved hypothetical protein [Hexamita inflata]